MTVDQSPWAGIWIAEDIELIARGVENGSWVDGVRDVRLPISERLPRIPDFRLAA